MRQDSATTRILRLSLVFLLVTWTLPPLDVHAESCVDCAPADSGHGWYLNTDGSATTVCFRAGDFSQDERDAIGEGFQYWQDYFDSIHEANVPHFDIVGEGTGCNVTVYKLDLPSGKGGETVGGSGSGAIFLNSKYWGNDGQHGGTLGALEKVAGHEVGHLQDFGDQYNSNCDGKTVMISGTVDVTDPSELMANVQCSDGILGTRRYFGGPNPINGGGGGDYEGVLDGEWCVLHWWVTDYYYWNGSEWEYQYTYWEFLYATNCEPLECC